MLALLDHKAYRAFKVCRASKAMLVQLVHREFKATLDQQAQLEARAIQA